MPMIPSVDYRPHLDGIRGLAILLVVAHHAGHLGGGHVGVVLFFVLSGYLITCLLLDERDRVGSADLRAFYLRRVARLLPALVLALVFLTAILGVREIAPAAIALFYGTNIAIAVAGFNEFSYAGWSWSLSLEEQFYILWPWFLRNIKRGSFRAVTILATVAALIAVIRAGVAIKHPVAAYNGPDRADAVLLGCALAISDRSLRPIAGWAGLLGIGALAVWGGIGEFSFQYGIALAAVASVLLIAGSGSGVLRRVFSTGALRHFGKISYALYIWNGTLGRLYEDHWGLHRTNPLIDLSWLALSITAAELSTRFVETPIRQWMKTRLSERGRHSAGLVVTSLDSEGASRPLRDGVGGL